MSWSELQRLVEEAEADGALQRALRHCRSLRELLLAARRLGYAIDRQDLDLARDLDRREVSCGSALGS
ncbi:MAG: Nif11-like leader peptide family natural product precursor [Cyanobium sp.]